MGDDVKCPSCFTVGPDRGLITWLTAWEHRCPHGVPCPGRLAARITCELCKQYAEDNGITVESPAHAQLVSVLPTPKGKSKRAIVLYLTEPEKLEVEAKARALGIPVSHYIRRALFPASKP